MTLTAPERKWVTYMRDPSRLAATLCGVLSTLMAASSTTAVRAGRTRSRRRSVIPMPFVVDGPIGPAGLAARRSGRRTLRSRLRRCLGELHRGGSGEVVEGDRDLVPHDALRKTLRDAEQRRPVVGERGPLQHD